MRRSSQSSAISNCEVNPLTDEIESLPSVAVSACCCRFGIIIALLFFEVVQFIFVGVRGENKSFVA